MAKTEFEFDVTFEDLLFADGEAGLNEILDARLEEAGVTHMATDVSYEAVKMTNKTGQITIKATYEPEEDAFDGDEDGVEG